jgi:hypothetical protein
VELLSCYLDIAANDSIDSDVATGGSQPTAHGAGDLNIPTGEVRVLLNHTRGIQRDVAARNGSVPIDHTPYVNFATDCANRSTDPSADFLLSCGYQVITAHRPAKQSFAAGEDEVAGNAVHQAGRAPPNYVVANPDEIAAGAAAPDR